MISAERFRRVVREMKGCTHKLAKTLRVVDHTPPITMGNQCTMFDDTTFTELYSSFIL